jgi:hypothetical protein
MIDHSLVEVGVQAQTLMLLSREESRHPEALLEMRLLPPHPNHAEHVSSWHDTNAG